MEFPIPDTFDDVATAADIMACFRLLLGRNPKPGEWAGHAMQVGQPLEQVVAAYVNCLEFSRRPLRADVLPETVELAKFPRFSMYADRADPLVGMHVIHGSYEPEVVSLLEGILQPGMGVLDIGANIGFFSMLSAALVEPTGFVMAVEPNMKNVRLLEASRRLNGFAHLSVLQAAAGAAVGLLALHVMHTTGVTSDLTDVQSSFANDLVPCLPLDAVWPAGRKIDLIKIDVEGSEYLALQGALHLIERHQPIIITEFSPDGLVSLSGIKGIDYLHWLVERGYALSVIEADGSTTSTYPDEILRRLVDRRGGHLDLIGYANRRPPWWKRF
jgi:FkbM family methyltransferase